jgi:hypothetical protein
MRRYVAHPRQRTEVESVRCALDAVQSRQSIDVDQRRPTDDALFHPVHKLGAAGDGPGIWFAPQRV